MGEIRGQSGVCGTRYRLKAPFLVEESRLQPVKLQPRPYIPNL